MADSKSIDAIKVKLSTYEEIFDYLQRLRNIDPKRIDVEQECHRRYYPRSLAEEDGEEEEAGKVWKWVDDQYMFCGLYGRFLESVVDTELCQLVASMAAEADEELKATLAGTRGQKGKQRKELKRQGRALEEQFTKLASNAEALLHRHAKECAESSEDSLDDDDDDDVLAATPTLLVPVTG